MEENEVNPATAVGLAWAQRSEHMAVAPAWHTVVLILAVLTASIYQAGRFAAPHEAVHRLTTYGLTAALELGMLAWVVIGLRLKKKALRELLGRFSFGARSIGADIGVALVFWFGSMLVLGSCAIAWAGAEAVLTHRMPSVTMGQPPAPSPAQREALEAMSELAPSNGAEVAAWALLCALAGFVEEIVFRGYLQRQFIVLSRGRVWAGVLLSALCFGAAHGYEGARGMFLITIFGVLFSLLVLLRRSLRPGMMAHAWQDLIAGLALALLKAHHVI